MEFYINFISTRFSYLRTCALMFLLGMVILFVETFFPVTYLNQTYYCRSASKEKEISRQRDLLDDTKKVLHEKEQALFKEQALLNQRDDNILERLAYITHSEKRLEEEKINLEDERKVLMEEKNKLDLKMQAIISREEVCIVSFPSILLLLAAEFGYRNCAYCTEISFILLLAAVLY